MSLKYRTIACFLLVISMLLTGLTGTGFAQTSKTFNPSSDAELNQQISTLVETRVREGFKFHGLASYYNNVTYYIVDEGGAKAIKRGKEEIITGNQWLVAAGRHKVLAIRSHNITARAEESSDKVILSTSGDAQVITELTDRANLTAVDPVLKKIRYKHLWAPFAWIAIFLDACLVFIHSHGIASWGWSIVVFSVLLKFVTIPLGNLTTRAQTRVNTVQTKLAPVLADIKANYKGEQAHQKYMKAHKDLEVTTFYTLTPLLATMIQIPILIAIFNAMGEMPQFSGQSFLWIDDLSKPDALFNLGFTIPWVGNTFNLMPFLMTGINIVSTASLKNEEATVENLRKQKRNLYCMAGGFFFIFYTFPAVMVLYWALVNLYQWMLTFIRKKQ